MAENSWHRYDMKKLRHCHPMYSIDTLCLHCSMYSKIASIPRLNLLPPQLANFSTMDKKLADTFEKLKCYQ